VTDRLPPRIPRAEAVGHPAILTRLYDTHEEIGRVDEDLAANQREYEELSERRHALVSEHDRLRRKLVQLDQAVT
jgi:chromosome segregation ATPase